jgi:hypothetical protein
MAGDRKSCVGQRKKARRHGKSRSHSSHLATLDQRDVRECRVLKARDPTSTAQQVFDHSRRNA